MGTGPRSSELPALLDLLAVFGRSNELLQDGSTDHTTICFVRKACELASWLVVGLLHPKVNLLDRALVE